jgi:drug/metabolite transporter (DMT)-like permease
MRGLTQRHGWAWCLAAAALFGASTPAIKRVVGDVHPITLAGLLYLGAAIATAPFADLASPHRATNGARRRLAIAVLVGGGIAPVLLVLALDRTPASTVSLLLNLELVATAVVAWLFLHEHIGHRAAGGIGVLLAGGVLAAGGDGAHFTGGALLVVGACLCWGIDNAVTASLDAYSPAQITFAKGAIAGTVNLCLGLAIDGWPSLRVAVLALAIGALGYGLSITMWITGARQVGAARGQVLFAMAPFVGALLAWPLNDEPPGALTAAAFAVSLTGVLVVASARHQHLHTHVTQRHAHPIDPTDPHHAPGAIEVVEGDEHRHLTVTHTHEHLPDIHHRHVH